VGARNVRAGFGKSWVPHSLICDLEKRTGCLGCESFLPKTNALCVCHGSRGQSHLARAIAFSGEKEWQLPLRIVVFDQKTGAIYCALFWELSRNGGLSCRTLCADMPAARCLFLGQDRIQVVLITIMNGLVFAHRKNIADEISKPHRTPHMHAESDNLMSNTATAYL